MAFFGTSSKPCKWVTNGSTHTITIPNYDFKVVADQVPTPSYRAEITGRLSKSGLSGNMYDTIKLGNYSSPVLNSHAPIVTDVRHEGSKTGPYKQCNYYGKIKDGGYSGAKLYSDNFSLIASGHPLIPNGLRYTYYNTDYNEADPDVHVLKVNSLKNNPNPNGNDEIEEITLLNYDKSPDSIRVRWNTHIILTPADGGGETVFDVFAIRARFCLNYRDSLSFESNRWSNWYYDFAPTHNIWDVGIHAMTLGGNLSYYSDGSASNNWYGYGSLDALESAFKEGKNIDRFGRNYIPPHFPYYIVVQVQVANMCGVGSSTNITHNSIDEHGRTILDNGEAVTAPGKVYHRLPDRSIYVRPDLNNLSITNAKPYIDYGVIELEPPSGCMMDFTANSQIDSNGNHMWFGFEGTGYLKIRKLQIYAKPHGTNEDYKGVFKWTGIARYDADKNINVAKAGGTDDENPRDLFKVIQSKTKLFLAKQDIDWGPTRVLEGNNDDDGINRRVFKPNTAYDLKVYYTVQLNYSKNAYYRQWCSTDFNGDPPATEFKKDPSYGWKLKHILVKKCKEFTTVFKTLPISKIFNWDKDLDTGATTPYTYIFGRSQLGDYPMQFRVERQIKMADSENITVKDDNHSELWDYNYDQQVTMRVTLTATKGSTTVSIQKKLVKTDIGQRSSTYNDPRNNSSDPTPNGPNKYNGIVFTGSQYFGYKNYYPKIYLNQKQWDDLYRLYPSYGAANLNQISVKVSIESQSTYKDDDGNPIWYKTTNPEQDDRTITLKLTGIEPTSHVKDAGNGQTFRRARVWVKDAGNGQTFKRAVTWVKDKNNGQSFKRSI